MASKEFFLGNIKGIPGIPGASNTNYRIVQIKKEEWQSTITDDTWLVDLSSRYYVNIDVSQITMPLTKSYWIFGQEVGLSVSETTEFENKVNIETGIITIYTNIPKDYKICIINGGEENIQTPTVITHNMESIYGIDNIGKNEWCNRIEDSIDLNVTKEWSIATTIWNSDFKTKAYPWNTITRETIRISRADGSEYDNYFVKIPKFYHKFIKNNDGSYKLLISGTKHDDTWQTAFINGDQEVDYVLIGENIGSLTYHDPPELTSENVKYTARPEISTIDALRQKAEANGVGYHLFDIWDYEILKILFLVEFSTTNSKNIFPWDPGYIDQMDAYYATYSIRRYTPLENFAKKVNPQVYGVETSMFLNIFRPYLNIFVDGIKIDHLNNLIIDKDIRNYKNNNSSTAVKIQNHPLLQGQDTYLGVVNSSEPLDELSALDLPKTFSRNYNGVFGWSDVNVTKPTEANKYSCCIIGGNALNPTDLTNLTEEELIQYMMYLKKGNNLWDLEFNLADTTSKWSRLCYKPIGGAQ